MRSSSGSQTTEAVGLGDVCVFLVSADHDAYRANPTMVMRRQLACVALASSLWAWTAAAAEITRVASSFEEKDPFGMLLNFTFDRAWDRGKITREWYQEGGLTDVTELNYARDETRLGIDMHVGIFRDVEFHIGVPIVFQQDRQWTFAAGTTAANSTLFRNCGDARGTPCATPGAGDGRLFEVGTDGRTTYRGGLGDFTFGLAWNVFNQAKDDTKPTWTLRIDYTAPTASVLNPSLETTSGRRGNIGDRVHRYQFVTALSRRLGEYFEPYFSVSYTLPWVGPGAYSNCADPSDLRMARAENCGQAPWTFAETRVRPAHVGLVSFGNEIIAFERPDRFQRVVVDLRAFLQYTSEGRYYNEMSDLLGKLLFNSDYGTVGGQLGFAGQAAEFVMLRASASLGYQTERYLTLETVGRDENANGTIDVASNPIELNPNYDFRIDRAGRRFRMQEQVVFRVMVTATLNF
jgi:hypothetical protein